MTARLDNPVSSVHRGAPHFHGKASHEHPYDVDAPHSHGADLAGPSSPAPRGYSRPYFPDAGADAFATRSTVEIVDSAPQGRPVFPEDVVLLPGSSLDDEE